MQYLIWLFSCMFLSSHPPQLHNARIHRKCPKASLNPGILLTSYLLNCPTHNDSINYAYVHFLSIRINSRQASISVLLQGPARYWLWSLYLAPPKELKWKLDGSFTRMPRKCVNDKKYGHIDELSDLRKPWHWSGWPSITKDRHTKLLQVHD